MEEEGPRGAEVPTGHAEGLGCPLNISCPGFGAIFWRLSDRRLC